MTSARRLHAHARALRAALAVTGSARHLPHTTLLLCALAPPLIATACKGQERHDEPPALTSPAREESSVTASSTEAQQVAEPSPPSCLDEQGHTMWQCCAEDRQAIGCDFCETPYPDQTGACLSCWPYSRAGDNQYNACCQMFDAFEAREAAGCAPWGPPAPPRYQGASLALMPMSAAHTGRHARRARLG